MTIQDARIKYGHIYKVSICEQDYIYRPLTVGEYRSILLDVEDSHVIEERIINTCVIDPEPSTIDFDNLPGKLPRELRDCILNSSMLDNELKWDAYLERRSSLLRKTKDEYGVNRIKDSIGAVMCTITAAFPGTDIIKLSELPMDKLLDVLALAQYTLGTIDKGRESEEIPRSMPLGLSQMEKQQYKESAAAAHARAELKKKWEEDKMAYQESTDNHTSGR